MRATVDHSARGFTLLELLLVIVVIGIIASLAMPAVLRQDDASLLQQSARSLLAGMSLQEEEAVLTASLRALQLYRSQENSAGVYYQWYTWSHTLASWEPATGTVAGGKLEGASRALLRVDDREVELPLLEPGGFAPRDGEQLEPQILFLASGEVSDFELMLEPANGVGAQTFTGGYDGVRLSSREDNGR